MLLYDYPNKLLFFQSHPVCVRTALCMITCRRTRDHLVLGLRMIIWFIDHAVRKFSMYMIAETMVVRLHSLSLLVSVYMTQFY